MFLGKHTWEHLNQFDYYFFIMFVIVRISCKNLHLFPFIVNHLEEINKLNWIRFKKEKFAKNSAFFNVIGILDRTASVESAKLVINTHRHRYGLAGRDAVGASLRVLVHERAVNLAASTRLILPVTRDLLAVFLEIKRKNKHPNRNIMLWFY